MSDEDTVPLDEEQRIREQSLYSLDQLGFTASGNLPLWSEWSGQSLKLRPATEVVQRLMCFHVFSLYLSPEANAEAEIRDYIGRNGLTAAINAEEKAVLALDREAALEQFIQRRGWSQEGLWAIAWTLAFKPAPGLRDGMIDDTVFSPLSTEFLPLLGETVPEFLLAHPLRSADEIVRMHDPFYCAPNAVINAQQGRDTVPDGFDPIVDGGIIHEKRHALTWCLSPGVAWDATDLST